MTADTRTPCHIWASGTYWCLPIHSEVPSASTAHPAHSAASSQTLRRRQDTARPNSARTVRTVPNIGSPSLSLPCRNGPARPSSPKSATRGAGVNMPGSPMPYCL
jgi:hypothetical protein